jgi:short-subunit dehydrogenase
MTERKVIVITGASRGIGKAIAKQLAEKKHYLFLVASDIHSFQDKDFPATRLAGDFGSDAAITEITQSILTQTSHVDVLINNLGMYIGKPFADTNSDEFARLMQVNFNGPALFTQQILPLLKKGKHPQIINISSIAAKQGMTDMAVYAASKSAITGFSNALRKEVNPQGIRVSVLHPAGVNTWNDPNPEHLLLPEDIANIVDLVVHTSGKCQIDDLTVTSL